MKISTRFSGKRGLYVSVKPAGKLTALLNFLQDLVRPDVTDLHCTVMYSKVAVHPVSAARLVASGPTIYATRVVGLEFWDGHDNEGYLVAKLECEALRCRHAAWRALGAVASFQDYTPHMTLSTGVQYTPRQLCAANKALSCYSLPLAFTGEHVEDLK